MGWWRRFFNGLVSRDKSRTTGLILGFMAWTLMRLVGGIASVFDFVACNQAGLLPAPVMHFLSVAAGVPKGEPHA